jgi:hypothetical protein
MNYATLIITVKYKICNPNITVLYETHNPDYHCEEYPIDPDYLYGTSLIQILSLIYKYKIIQLEISCQFNQTAGRRGQLSQIQLSV